MPVRGRRVVCDEDEDYVDEDDSCRPSIETDTSMSPEIIDTAPTVVTINTAPRTTNTKSQIPRPRTLASPRPRHEYPVPAEMESLYKALGENNWNEYLTLMEKKWLGEITENEVMVKSKSIFSVFDECTRRRVEKGVINKVIIPVLGQRVI
ncbi:hypothetical protein GQ44DRAFT_709615, partial [Phaeosphaeriaceae sp. PMI808]